MKIVFLGTGAFGIPSLEALKKAGAPVLAIVTNPDKPQGRSLRSKSSPTKEWALKNHVRVIESENINTPEVQQQLRALEADIFIVIAFGSILSTATLSIPKKMSLNVHASLLPNYRGAAPIHWALLNGDPETGVSVIRMTEKLDAGDVAAQKRTAITPDDDILSLFKRLSELGGQALAETMDHLSKNDNIVFSPQGPVAGDYARKLTKEDGRIDWSKPSQAILRQLRALKIWPGSYTFYKGKRLIFLKASGENQATPSQPGTVLEASPQKGLIIACGQGAMAVETLQLEGKKPVSSQEFLKGFTIKTGDHFV